jgi:hypothetical protein
MFTQTNRVEMFQVAKRSSSGDQGNIKPCLRQNIGHNRDVIIYNLRIDTILNRFGCCISFDWGSDGNLSPIEWW